MAGDTSERSQPSLPTSREAATSQSTDTSNAEKQQSLPGDTNGTLEKQESIPDDTANVSSPIPMTQFRRMVIFVSMALMMLLATLESTIITTAIPHITIEFHALSEASWIATAYLLTSTALQPLYGRLSDIFGRAPMLVATLAVFIAGSAACGWAQSMGVLIFGRALQGVGGAGLLSLVFIVISDITTEEQRPKFLGVLGAVWSIAAVVGPLLGGVFADKASWRWAFLFNLPAGGAILVVILGFLRLPIPRDSFWAKLKRVDFLGSLVLIGAVVMLLLSLSWAGKDFAWGSARVVCMLVFGILGLVVFMLIEWKAAAEPTVPLHLFRIRNVCLSVVGQFFMGVGTFSPMFFMPIWYTVVKNASAISAGLHMLPYLLSVSLVSIVSGFLVSKTKIYRPYVIGGTVLFVLGSGLLILLDESSNMGKQIGFMVVMGFGLGLNIQILLIVVQTAAPVEDMASATSLFLFMRAMGSSIGVAALQSVLQNAIIPKLNHLAAIYPDHAQAITDSLNDQSAIYSASMPADLQALLVHEYVLALRKVFIAIVPFNAVALLFTLPLEHVPLRLSSSE